MVKKAATCLNRQFIAAPVTFDCQTTGHVIGSSRDVTSTARGTTSTRARRQIGFGQVQIGSATGQFRSTLHQNQSIATNTIQYKIVLRSGSIEKLNAKSRRRKYQGIMPSSDSCESAISRRESTEKRHVPADLSVENKRRCILITLSNDTRIDASPARSRFFLLSIDDLKGDHTCVTLTTNNGGWNGGRKGVDAEKSASINGPDTCKAPPADQSEAAAAATRACSDRASDSCHAVLIATEMALLVDESKTILSFYKIATTASPQCIGCRNVRVNGPIMPRLQNNFTMGPVSEGSPSPSDEKTQHTHLAQYCKSKRRVCADRISFHLKLGVLLRAGLCPRGPPGKSLIENLNFEILRLFDVSETRLVDLTKSCGFVRKKFLSQQTPFRDRLNGKATNLVSALRLLARNLSKEGTPPKKKKPHRPILQSVFPGNTRGTTNKKKRRDVVVIIAHAGDVLPRFDVLISAAGGEPATPEDFRRDPDRRTLPSSPPTPSDPQLSIDLNSYIPMKIIPRTRILVRSLQKFYQSRMGLVNLSAAHEQTSRRQLRPRPLHNGAVTARLSQLPVEEMQTLAPPMPFSPRTKLSPNLRHTDSYGVNEPDYHNSLSPLAIYGSLLLMKFIMSSKLHRNSAKTHVRRVLQLISPTGPSSVKPSRTNRALFDDSSICIFSMSLSAHMFTATKPSRSESGRLVVSFEKQARLHAPPEEENEQTATHSRTRRTTVPLPPAIPSCYKLDHRS
ncbi:hypothetical protein GEV33_013330 [Tenebrio molitor]|uniref:Uncharacterized protein n=1 Tax=Tenebrio molitor TaxID=7067 RepID=A0A8J6H7E8_TENMO|nr:hypothetical protein GEV33_013330 [Tenebrio molitor]